MSPSILDKRQIQFLDLVQGELFLKDNFYLTGGTALAGFYLHHRYSEDLDFFTDKEIDLLNLNSTLLAIKQKMKANRSEAQQSYNRNLFFLYFGKKMLKTEFTFFPFPRIKKTEALNGIQIDSLEDIAVNKLFTIYQRVAARDYIDLYFIIQKRKFKIADLIKQAKAKFDWHIDPIQLGAQFIKAEDAEDLPRMIKPIKTSDWRKFFKDEAKQLKGMII